MEKEVRKLARIKGDEKKVRKAFDIVTGRFYGCRKYSGFLDLFETDLGRYGIRKAVHIVRR